MQPTTEIWKLNGLIKSYLKKRFEIIEEDGITKEIEDKLEREKVTFNQGGYLISRKNCDDNLEYQYKWNRDKLELKNFNNDDYVQVLLFDADDKTYCGEHTFKYNKKSFLIQENNYNANGDLLCYTCYKNDDWGKPLIVTQYRDGEVTMIEQYEYSLEGRIVSSKVSFPNDPSLSYSKSIVYDEEGNITEEEYLDPFLLPKYSHKYSYLKDNNGNWTKKFVYDGEKLKWYETREIKYFLDELF